MNQLIRYEIDKVDLENLVIYNKGYKFDIDIISNYSIIRIRKTHLMTKFVECDYNMPLYIEKGFREVDLRIGELIQSITGVAFYMEGKVLVFTKEVNDEN